MHQLIHCHTLSKPFSKIFLFRIYAPTVQTHPHHIDSIFAETSVRFPQIHTPIQPTQTNPPTTLPTHSTNSTPIQPHKHARKPIHQRHRPTTTLHRFRAHTAPQTHTATQPHKHPQPYAATHRHPQPPQPHSLHRHPQTRDAAPAPDVVDVDVDAVASRNDAIPRRCCSTDTVAESAIRQAKQTGSGHPSAIGQASIRQAKYRIRLDRPD